MKDVCYSSLMGKDIPEMIKSPELRVINKPLKIHHLNTKRGNMFVTEVRQCSSFASYRFLSFKARVFFVYSATNICRILNYSCSKGK